MRHLISLIILASLVFSCSNKKNDNLEKLDKLYGKCDNPQRHYGDLEYKICKDKEMAGNTNDAFSIQEYISKQIGDLKGTGVSTSAINDVLWKSSLQTVNQYSLKISDSAGGYLETEWIYQENEPLKRCKIKIQVISSDLVSTGVDSKLVCEDKKNDQWYPDNQIYLEENKKLNLSILEKTQTFLSSQ